MSLTIGAHPKYSSTSNNINNSEMLVSDESKKHNHSEIEKRRRDKMNHYITELSCLIPMCNAMSRKLDKLTVLRMAVQHMKTIKGSMNAFAGSGKIRPTFLSDEALLKLISQQISEGFLFVVSCDRGRILFVSGSVSQVLNYSQGDLLGQNWFDILHPKDVAKVKEQLSSSDLSPKERLIDAKTMLPVKSTASPSSQVNMSPGARRSFFCRMKFKSMPRVKEEADTTTGYAQKRRKSQSSDRKYCVVHCIGYLKSWISTKMSVTEESENESDIYNMSCLVAIGRTLPNLCGPTPHQPDISIKPISFTSRHTIDGKFLFVDQRATLILGYLPQELLGTCCYEYCHHEDLKILAESHRLGLEASGENSKSAGYRFKTKSGPYICLQTTWKTFRNPWTKEFEFLIAVNTCVSDIDKVESSVNVENSNNNNNNYVTASWKTSSTVDDILFRISDSCKNRAHKSNGNSNSSNTGTNNTTNGNNLGVGNGGASSNEQSSTGYSSTDTRSVQKMLASSRVALWKIGRYIADEVIENQRRYEESNFLLTASPYSSSTIPITNTFVTTDSEFDKLKKWRPDNVARGLIASQIKSSGLIQLDNLHSQQQQQSQLGPSNPTTSVNANNSLNSNCNNNNNNVVTNNVNKNEINSSSSGNDSNIWLDSGSLATLAGPSAVESDLSLTVSDNEGVTSISSISTGNCTMETDTSSYGTNGVDTKSSYRHENNYDPLGVGGRTTNSGSSLPNGINVNSVDPTTNDSTTNATQNWQNSNCLTSLTCISGDDFYRTSDASLPILPESSNETDDNSHILTRGHTADDQENEDVAMDLIMSILENEERNRDPNDPPVPWYLEPHFSHLKE
ncbi:aryl hydrocarbon receptor nuclear translocator-like protein 1 isoform X1 [Tetranychus urticae]|uniref:aryl hydrocarbon receptor nuclear translocator-like protein 1 isoform X1 n=1 Tax=Tetranychus urticae TaxID=32264 RepID=UPI00077BF68D|nr:aryl hydrocarbon receptor nuclear translocator-like protein 1 isoform X1 [Tetranychus urticae]XP_015785356.1 aryl hydrocarbon receptor nuclear translocator-like protein 1 isoform X1 [Tetranychus urticae]